MGFWERVIDRARHIAIPALALASTRVAGVMRLMRFSLLDTLRQEYVTVARAKGVPEATVVLKHACRNALNPLLSLLGLELGGLFSGAALVECVTGWPGLGKVILAGAWSRDCNLVLGSLMLSSMFLTGGNLLSDILLAVSDPRIYDQTSAYRTTGRAPSHDRDDAMLDENEGRRHARKT
ncbi:MAG: Dipeptide transport system permease protein DppB [Actinobacteria bacterium ADurb.Bin444]|nr:MAG: Dipeptide transport system permease protein DppB [Actinobacteria bacterium ADurb.Bin444]